MVKVIFEKRVNGSMIWSIIFAEKKSWALPGRTKGGSNCPSGHSLGLDTHSTTSQVPDASPG